MKVLYEDNHVLCVEKPVNVPMNSDDTKDDNLLDTCKQYIKEKYNKPGNVYLGLIHRLDRPVSGCVVFARTSKAASRLSESVRTHKLIKEYLAVLDGVPARTSAILEDYLVKDKNTNTVTVTDASHGKYSKLYYEVLAVKENRALVYIRLYTGRSHQIRVQFASRGTPLVHDFRYNKKPGKGQIALHAWRLTFPHPTTKERITVTSLPDPSDPWNQFEVKKLCQQKNVVPIPEDTH